MDIKDISIMICDDSSLVRKKVKDMLINFGCTEILEVRDGEEAVTQYKSFMPDLVLMDIVMPVKTGLEAVGEIIGFDPDAKIVMISSTGTKSNLREALEAGAYEFLQKPVEEAAIKDILVKFIKGGK